MKMLKESKRMRKALFGSGEGLIYSLCADPVSGKDCYQMRFKGRGGSTAELSLQPGRSPCSIEYIAYSGLARTNITEAPQ